MSQRSARHFADGIDAIAEHPPERFRIVGSAWESAPHSDHGDGLVPCALGLFQFGAQRPEFHDRPLYRAKVAPALEDCCPLSFSNSDPLLPVFLVLLAPHSHFRRDELTTCAIKSDYDNSLASIASASASDICLQFACGLALFLLLLSCSGRRSNSAWPSKHFAQCTLPERSHGGVIEHDRRRQGFSNAGLEAVLQLDGHQRVHPESRQALVQVELERRAESENLDGLFANMRLKQRRGAYSADAWPSCSSSAGCCAALGAASVRARGFFPGQPRENFSTDTPAGSDSTYCRQSTDITPPGPDPRPAVVPRHAAPCAGIGSKPFRRRRSLTPPCVAAPISPHGPQLMLSAGRPRECR